MLITFMWLLQVRDLCVWLLEENSAMADRLLSMFLWQLRDVKRGEVIRDIFLPDIMAPATMKTIGEPAWQLRLPSCLEPAGRCQWAQSSLSTSCIHGRSTRRIAELQSLMANCNTGSAA